MCGNVVFTVTKFAEQMAHCHCVDCRKFHGAAFSTFGQASTSDVYWFTGQEQLTTFAADNGSKRQFCSHCGCSMTFQSANHSETIEIALATLDNNETLIPDAHVFVESKVRWLTIDDSLPKYARNRHS